MLLVHLGREQVEEIHYVIRASSGQCNKKTTWETSSSSFLCSLLMLLAHATCHYGITLPESVSESHCEYLYWLFLTRLFGKSERAKKASNKETAPRSHRGKRQAGCQKVIMEPSLWGSQSLSHLRLPNGHPSINISPGTQGEADVRSLEGLWCCRHWRGCHQPCG
jgi:hypothetical protein